MKADIASHATCSALFLNNPKNGKQEDTGYPSCPWLYHLRGPMLEHFWTDHRWFSGLFGFHDLPCCCFKQDLVPSAPSPSWFNLDETMWKLAEGRIIGTGHDGISPRFR